MVQVILDELATNLSEVELLCWMVERYAHMR